MNKERELLKECRLILDTPFNGSTGINLRNRIAELLAQPEQDQEPMAWTYDRSYGDNGLFVECVTTDYWEIDEHLELSNCSNIRPLYASPPKRERLSYSRTADLFHANKKATNAVCYWAGVYDAEKAHGITGVEDETL